METSQEGGIVGEIEKVSLRETRLERRLAKFAEAMEGAPGDSFVEQVHNVAALEATVHALPEVEVIGNFGKLVRVL